MRIAKFKILNLYFGGFIVLEKKNFDLKNVYIRYEPKIDGGTVFIFNRDTGKMFEGNSDLYNVISLIREGYSSEAIQKVIEKAYQMNEEIDQLINDLLEKLLLEDIIEIRSDN